MIDVAMLRAIGITDAQLAKLFELVEKARLEKVAAAREANRIRQRNHRARTNVTRDASDSCDTPLILSSLPSLVVSSSEEVRKEDVSVAGRPVKKRLAPLPVDWEMPQRALQLADELGIPAGPVEGIFRDYLKSSGKQYADYDAAFCNFIRNQPKFNGGNGHGRPQRQTLGDRARNIADQIRQQEHDAGVSGTLNLERRR